MDPKLLMYTRASPFSGAVGEDWDTWIGRFEARTAQLSDSDKLHVLVSLLEGKALDTCAALSDEKQKEYTAVKSNLENTFGSKIDELQAFASFSQATRQPNESVQSFGDRLKKLARWTYRNQADTNDQVVQTVVNRFICGLQDPWLQRKLFIDKPKTIDEAISKVTELHRQQQVIASLTPDPGSVMALQACPTSGTGIGGGVPAVWEQPYQQPGNLQPAPVAGSAATPRPSPAGGRPSRNDQQDRDSIRCFGCGEVGHIRRFCPNTRQSHQQKRTNTTRERRSPWCLCCGEDGHWMVECQHYQRLISQRQKSPDRRETRVKTSGAYQPPQSENW